MSAHPQHLAIARHSAEAQGERGSFIGQRQDSAPPRPKEMRIQHCSREKSRLCMVLADASGTGSLTEPRGHLSNSTGNRAKLQFPLA